MFILILFYYYFVPNKQRSLKREAILHFGYKSKEAVWIVGHGKDELIVNCELPEGHEKSVFLPL